MIDLGSNDDCGCHGSDGLDLDLGTDADLDTEADVSLGSDDATSTPVAGTNPGAGDIGATSPVGDASPRSATAVRGEVAPGKSVRASVATNRGAQPVTNSLPDTAMGSPDTEPLGLLLLSVVGLSVWRRYLVAPAR